MGIRESFEKHPRGEKDLNIHDLAIEKKEKPEELKFDPESEISDEDWEKILEYILDLNEATQLEREGSLDGYTITRDSFLEYLLKVKFISSDEFDKIMTKFGDVIKTSKQDVQNFWDVKKENIFFSRPSYDYYGTQIGLDFSMIKTESEQTVKDELEKFRSTIGESTAFPVFAAAMRLKGFKKEEFNLDDDDWQKMKNHLARLRQNESWAAFVPLALSMKILAAHEVKIGDEGLEFVMRKPKEFHAKRDKRPERRQF